MKRIQIMTGGMAILATSSLYAVPPTLSGVRYPGGKIAVVADGNSRDPDDIGGTAFSIALLKAAGMDQHLVHYSHSCDLVRDATKITAARERERFTEMAASCRGTFSRWSVTNSEFFNASPAPRQANPTTAQENAAIAEAAAAVTDLAEAINASTSSSPLYIVEAGEPDVIYQALDEAQFFKSRNVRIITHSVENDESGDFHDLSDITTDFPDVTVLRIPDQNTNLVAEINSQGNSAYDWARDSTDGKIRWLHARLVRAEEESDVAPFQANRYDPSDAGMVAYWVTGADGAGSLGGRQTPTANTLNALINR